MKTGIIYGFFNPTTEKWYVGRDLNPPGRYKGHQKAQLNTHFHNAIRKYGFEHFKYIILADNITEEHLAEAEVYWIMCQNSFHNGYNMTVGGEGAMGFKHSTETRQKMRGRTPWNKGKQGIYSDETLQSMRESSKGQVAWNKGKTGQVAWNKGLPGTFSGKRHTAETRGKMSEAHKGKRLSAQTRAKISDSKKGERHPNYGKTGSDHPNFGKKFPNAHSPESRKQISESMRKYWQAKKAKKTPQ